MLGSSEPAVQEQVTLGMSTGGPGASREGFLEEARFRDEGEKALQAAVGACGEDPGGCAVPAVSLSITERSAASRELQRPLEWTPPLGWGQHAG